MTTQSPRTGSVLGYHGASLGVTLGAVALASVLWGLQAGFLVAVLCVLEISLSLDNAVVNAKVLEHWDDKWRKIFMTWGILVATFGMRLLFPILIVCVATGLGPVDVTQMALNSPDVYAEHMKSAHHEIAGFGGAFLLMVALGFFFGEKHQHWIEWMETRLTRFGQIEGVAVAVTLGALFAAQTLMPVAQKTEFFYAGIMGIIVFVVTHGLGTLFDSGDDDDSPVTKVVRAGVMGFVYLEILDASFSFDGVIGAFVLTTYLPIIMLGLGSGAFFVRSFTVHLVEAGTLSEYRYLEHGAFYAILTLAVIMLLPGLHLPEWVTGLSGAAILGLAFGHSILANRREATA